ncbi:MAG: hypothetical protein ABI212_04345, partial [Burkholderiaceae bacterium]
AAFGLQSLFADASALNRWLGRWRARLAQDPVHAADRASAMRAVNPLYVPRNHKVEEALAAAVEKGDQASFEKLLSVLARPFDERAGLAAYAEPAPAEQTARYRTFCGT